MPHMVKRKAQYRLSVFSRIAAAMIGAYGVTALIAMLLSQLLQWAGMDAAQAVLAATIPAFLLYAAIICAIFYARSATRAWTMLAITAAPLACLVALLTRLMP